MKIEDILVPERDLLLVRREVGNETEWHGIALPTSARKTDHIAGTVLRSGPDAYYAPGARVVMSRGAGTTVALLDGDGEEVALIQPMDVLALLPDEEVA